MSPSEMPEAIAATIQVVAAFEKMDVPYLIGGSLASMVHGVIRLTQDADIVADLCERHAVSLVDLLGTDFYADAE